MDIQNYGLDGRTGKIIELDEPGDLDTMYRLVHEHLREDIRAMRDALFVLVVFRRTPERASQDCLEQHPGWFPVQDRTQVHAANSWHKHGGVAVHCPYQLKAHT